MIRLRAALLFWICAGCVGWGDACAPGPVRVNPSEAAGTYVLSTTREDKLVLEPDGSYLHDQPRWRSTGRWEIIEVGGSPRLSLTHWEVAGTFDAESGGPGSRSFSSTYFVRTRRGVAIAVNPEMGIYYVKQ